MHIKDTFYLGYISKAIGTKGELAFKLDVDSPSSYLGIDAVLIQIFPNDETLVPYFIKQTQLQSSNILRCKLEGVENVQDAKALVGKAIFLPFGLLPKLKDDQFYFHEIIGFKVIDEAKGEIGKLEKVIEYPHQNLLSILVNDKEVLIPLNDQSFKGIDKEAKILRVNAPEGLIDLYLS